MSNLTADEFLAYLKQSELLEPQELETALAEIKRDASDSLGDAALLAEEFVKRNLITGWHVRQLLKRKYKGFYLRQYRILGHLGSGGMSSVYLGEHTVMKRRVAIKVLPKRKLNAVYIDRFMREAQAIASLDHPHIVRAYDVDRFEDVHYIVMEYFEGQNLRQLVEKEGPLAYEDAASYIRQAALGLGHAHRLGIVHRDVKPENILVNDQNLVKILDLGLALLDEANFARQGSSFDEDKILGTADYLAPEQALDSHNVDARADIYGLGATLYFCLTGRPPFPYGSIPERLLAHQKKEPASIFNERPDAPIDLVEICSIMMAKKPENRFQSMRQIVVALERWLVRHGFAKPSDFSQTDGDASLLETGDENETDDFDERIYNDADAERRFLQNETATESGFERGPFRISSADLTGGYSQGFAGDDVVDLYNAEDTGSLFRRRAPSSFRRPSGANADFLLTQRVDHAPLDPLEIALSEIADTTKTKLQQESSASRSALKLEPNSSGRSAPLGTTFGSTVFRPNVLSAAANDTKRSGYSNARSTDTQKRAVDATNASVSNVANETNRSSGPDAGERTAREVNLALSSENAAAKTTSTSATSSLTQTSQTTTDASFSVAKQISEIASESSADADSETQTTLARLLGDWARDVPLWFWTVSIGGYALAIFLAGILFTLLTNLK